MKNITTDQDIARHVRLTLAWNHIVHNDDSAAEAEYYDREAEHFNYCLKGTSAQDGKVYYERSPYSSIEVAGGGFILHNHVTGKQWPFATFDGAAACRTSITGRYHSIEHGMNQA